MKNSKKDLLNREISVDNLKLAELKYFDKEHNGVELTAPLSYIILFNNGNDYVNLLAPEESYPVFVRNAHYTNYLSNGEETYGAKVKLLTSMEKCETGPCWVLCSDDFKQKLGEVTTIRDIQNYILDSSNYFKDRLDVALFRLRRFQDRKRMKKIVEEDIQRRDELYTFFESRQEGQRYIK